MALITLKCLYPNPLKKNHEAIENNTKVYYETTDNIETGKTKITKFHF